MKLTDDNLRQLVSAQLVGRPWPNDYADHTNPNKKKSNNDMVQQTINNMSAELTSMC